MTEMHPPYRFVHKEYVGLLYLARLVPGKQFDVFVNPDNPEEILFEWDPYDTAALEQR